jgi:hypothetical protein
LEEYGDAETDSEEKCPRPEDENGKKAPKYRPNGEKIDYPKMPGGWLWVDEKVKKVKMLRDCKSTILY